MKILNESKSMLKENLGTINKELNRVIEKVFFYANTDGFNEKYKAKIIADLIRKSIEFNLKNNELFKDTYYVLDAGKFKDQFKLEKMQ